jgi:hypothetical protein
MEIITEQPSQRTWLAKASVGDAKHDFKKFVSTLIKFLKDKKNEFSSGLPHFNGKPEYEISDEKTLFAEVVKTFSEEIPTDLGPPEEDEGEADTIDAGEDDDDDDCDPNDETDVQDEYVPIKFFNRTCRNNKKYNFLEHNIKTISNYEFIVRGCSAFNPTFKYKRHVNEPFINAEQLIEQLGIRHQSAFVIDAMAIKLLEILKKGRKLNNENGEWFTIYLIDDVEIRSDPAGKTSWEAKYDEESGVQLIFLKPEDPRVISYSFIDGEDDISPDDFQDAAKMFFSNYNFKLATDIYGNGCNLIITDKGGNLLPTEVKDPKHENSIGSLSRILQSLVFRANSPQLVFDTNAKYQQKRSGDWLQVLLCKLLLFRTYKDRHGVTYDINNVPGGVYFLTHDRIALAFALFMGISSIFMHGKSGTMIVFDLLKEPQDLFRSAFDEMKSNLKYFDPIEPFNPSNFYETKYNAAQEQLIKYKTAYNETLGNLDIIIREKFGSISELVRYKKLDIPIFQNQIKESFKQLAVLSSFMVKFTDPINFEISQGVLPNETFSQVYQEALNTNDQTKQQQFTELAEYVKRETGRLKFFSSKLQNIETFCSETSIQNIRQVVEQPQPDVQAIASLIDSLDFESQKIFGKFTLRNMSSLQISQLHCFQFLQDFSNISSRVDLQNHIHNTFSTILLNLNPSIEFIGSNTRNLMARERDRMLMLFSSFFKEAYATFPIINEPSRIEEEEEAQIRETPLGSEASTIGYEILFDKSQDQEGESEEVPGKRKRDEEVANEEVELSPSSLITLVEEQNEMLQNDLNNNKCETENFTDNGKMSIGGGARDEYDLLYLKVKRINLLFKNYLERNTFFNMEDPPSELVFYMLGIAMVHQLENEEVYKTLDYDDYEKILAILKKNNIQGEFKIYANLFFNRKLSNRYSIFSLSRQLGSYFNLNIYSSIFNINGQEQQQLNEIEGEIINLPTIIKERNAKAYREFLSEVYISVIEIGENIKDKLMNHFFDEGNLKKSNIANANALGAYANNKLTPPSSPRGPSDDNFPFSPGPDDEEFGGGSKKKKTIKKQKKTNKKTRNKKSKSNKKTIKKKRKNKKKSTRK